jgi:hypothetical protein
MDLVSQSSRIVETFVRQDVGDVGFDVKSQYRMLICLCVQDVGEVGFDVKSQYRMLICLWM